MNLARNVLWISLGAALCACTAAPPAKPPGGAAEICNSVQTLVAAHRTGFAGLRGAQSSTRFGDIWAAQQQLIGNDCQIWGWGGGSFGYVCAVPAPNRETAMGYYQKARDFTARCLGTQWSVLESVGQSDDSHDAVFSRVGSNTVVAVRAVPVRGIAKSQWTAYYYIGDRNHLQ